MFDLHASLLEPGVNQAPTLVDFEDVTSEDTKLTPGEVVWGRKGRVGSPKEGGDGGLEGVERGGRQV